MKSLFVGSAKHILFVCVWPILIAVFLGGCGGFAEITKAYPGPQLSKDKVAIIKAGRVTDVLGPVAELVGIVKVDGGESLWTLKHIFEVEAGDRTFDLRIQMSGDPIAVLLAGGPRIESTEIRFRVEADHEYRIWAKRNLSNHPIYRVWVENIQTGATVAGQRPGIDAVIVEKSDPAYTVFMVIPEGKLQGMQSKIAGNQDVTVVAWSEFAQKSDEHLASKILKNEYQGSRVFEGMLKLLEKYHGTPFGLTWNGGVAITYNDYQYAKKTYEKYRENPENYERTRVRDPRLDPVKPEWHFGPLLGW